MPLRREPRNQVFRCKSPSVRRSHTSSCIHLENMSLSALISVSQMRPIQPICCPSLALLTKLCQNSLNLAQDIIADRDNWLLKIMKVNVPFKLWLKLSNFHCISLKNDRILSIAPGWWESDFHLIVGMDACFEEWVVPGKLDFRSVTN